MGRTNPREVELDLPPKQAAYLSWLMDPRPASGPVEYDSEGFVTASSPSKGTESSLAERLGIAVQSLQAYRKTVKFREAYRVALQDDIRDPMHMAKAIDRLNDIIATGQDKDALKAIEVLKGLTGFVVPTSVELPSKPASDMTDEELAKYA